MHIRHIGAKHHNKMSRPPISGLFQLTISDCKINRCFPLKNTDREDPIMFDSLFILLSATLSYHENTMLFRMFSKHFDSLKISIFCKLRGDKILSHHCNLNGVSGELGDIDTNIRIRVAHL